MPSVSTLRTAGTPVIALLVLVLVWNRELGPALVAVVAVVLIGAVLVAVHHAEVVAHRVGEPYGSLILAVAVTIIEVGLILSITASGGPQTATLARDTVFAAVMITCNGIVGLSLLVGAVRHHVVEFRAAGSGGAFAAVITLATLCLVVPAFTTSSPGPTFATAAARVRRRASRSCSTACTCSCRPFATATTSCRWSPEASTRTAKSTRSRRATAPR